MLCVFFFSLLCFTLVQCYDNYHLCAGNNLSCSYQLWTNNTEDACQMVYYLRNSFECQDEFLEVPKRNVARKDIIKIEPFLAYSDRRTIFRITAYNITWKNLKIRFKLQKTNNCMKREFFINGIVPKDKYLIYDCPWSSAIYEDRIIDFEYAYGVNNKYDGKRKFVIHVPKSELLSNLNSTNIQQLKLFTYVETTNLYEIIYKIHIATNMDVPTYEIYVNFTRNNETRINGPFLKTPETAVMGVIDFEYDTFGIPGKYVFYVRPWECTQCSFSVSPEVIITETSSILMIGIVGISCLIPIFLITLYMYMKVESGVTSRVLLLTTPANDAHEIIGKSIANLLKEKYNITTMMDIIDLKLMPTSTPSEWLKKSFENATHIVILISDHKPATSIYTNLDNLLHTLIETNPKKICCTIKFSFTQEPNIKFHVRRNFRFMRDYYAFINFIHNRGLLHKLKDRLTKNYLYYDLVAQINNYSNNVTLKPKLNLDVSDECDENKRNDLKMPMEVTEICDDIEIPSYIEEKVRKCLQENCNVSDMECDHLNKSNNQSDSESDTIINPYIRSLLENKS